MTVKTEVLLPHEEYRRDSYKLLSECYYLPDERLLQVLGCLDTSRGALYSEIARSIPGTSDIELLRVDYSKLFVGPYALMAPPYGSVYLEPMNQVMGNSTLDVKDKYTEEGLNISLKEAPDHIAIELEFMYHLIFKQVEAIRNSDFGNAASFLRKQRDFLETHLGIWVSEFVNNIEANAQAEFYRNLARLTKLFVEKDLKSLSDKLIMGFCQVEKIGGTQ